MIIRIYIENVHKVDLGVYRNTVQRAYDVQLIPIVSLEAGVTSLPCICVFITSYRLLCS